MKWRKPAALVVSIVVLVSTPSADRNTEHGFVARTFEGAGGLTLPLAEWLFSQRRPTESQRQATGFLDRVVTVSSETYRYQVYVPENYTADRLWPIVLFLHGSGERGSDGLLQTDSALASAIRKKRSRFPAIVVFPQARLEQRWNDAMQAHAVAALDAATVEFHGDRDRTYLTGLSMGGRGAWALAYKYPRRFAALAIIASAITTTTPDWTTTEKEVVVRENEFLRREDPYSALASKISGVPTWLFHGSADLVNPVTESRRMAQALQKLKADVKYTEYEDVPHNSWDKAYAEPGLMPWLLDQRRQTPALNNAFAVWRRRWLNGSPRLAK
jgi:predicted peptidase